MTYNTNRYGFYMGLETIRMASGTRAPIAFSFLSDMTRESYDWHLECSSKASPMPIEDAVFIVDEDQQMIDALTARGIRYFLCQWHFWRTISTHGERVFKTSWDAAREQLRWVWHSHTSVEFEKRWGTWQDEWMRDRGDCYFSRSGSLWLKRKQACLAFFHHFLGGMVASSIGESSNAAMKAHLNRAASAKAALEAVEMLQVEAASRHMAELSARPKVVKHPFLALFGHLLAPGARAIVASEIERIADYRVDSGGDRLSFRVHYAKDRDATVHDVVIRPVEEERAPVNMEIDSSSSDDVVIAPHLLVLTSPRDLSCTSERLAVAGAQGYVPVLREAFLEDRPLLCRQCGESITSPPCKATPWLLAAGTAVDTLTVPILQTLIKSHGIRIPARAPSKTELVRVATCVLNGTPPDAQEWKPVDYENPPRPMGKKLCTLVLMCSECSNSFHALCVGMLMSPKGKWTCLRCQYAGYKFFSSFALLPQRLSTQSRGGLCWKCHALDPRSSVQSRVPHDSLCGAVGSPGICNLSMLQLFVPSHPRPPLRPCVGCLRLWLAARAGLCPHGVVFRCPLL